MLVCHYITKIIPKNWTDKLQTQIACMFQNQETKYVSHLTGGAAKRKYIKYMVKRDIFHNTIDGEFEGYVFPIPKDYDFIVLNGGCSEELYDKIVKDMEKELGKEVIKTYLYPIVMAHTGPGSIGIAAVKKLDKEL